jgi:hypothetical protein
MTFDLNYGTDECDVLGSNGHFVEDARRIVIRKNLAPDKERECVLHEVLHACFVATNLGLGAEGEEAIVKALTGPLLEVLRSNPTLINYITNRE